MSVRSNFSSPHNMYKVQTVSKNKMIQNDNKYVGYSSYNVIYLDPILFNDISVLLQMCVLISICSGLFLGICFGVIYWQGCLGGQYIINLEDNIWNLGHFHKPIISNWYNSVLHNYAMYIRRLLCFVFVLSAYVIVDRFIIVYCIYDLSLCKHSVASDCGG